MNDNPAQKILEPFGNERRLHYDLERIRQALSHLDNPQKSPCTLVIGGTNGKGSTTLFISAALVQAGHKVCSYLSPHLQSPVERLLYGMEPIPSKLFLQIAEMLTPIGQKYSLSYFEFLTLMNFVWAHKQQAEYLVMEVGLGGKLDATNVTTPLACALTHVGLDHQEILGNTKEEILKDKLGIVPENGLLFSGISDPTLLSFLTARCKEQNITLHLTEETPTKTTDVSWEGRLCSIDGHPFFLNNSTQGTLENATLAYSLLRRVFPQIQISKIQEAFQRVNTPGRFETVSESPRILLSGDHNLDGIACLKETLSKLTTGRLFTLCGFSPDKPYQQMYAALKSISDKILLTHSTRDYDVLPETYWSLGESDPNPSVALEQLLKEVTPKDTLLVTGSLYLVGALRSRWLHQVSYFG